jgi:hypothetical protein
MAQKPRKKTNRKKSKYARKREYLHQESKWGFEFEDKKPWK